MTTIAYRDGALAADRATKMGAVQAYQTAKINQREDGAMIGGCGIGSVSAAFRRWFMDGEAGDRPSLGVTDDDDAQLIVVRPNGVVEIHDRHGWAEISGPFFALGSGFEVALGAMAMGASAERAVQIAAEFGIGNPNQIDVLRLPRPARAEDKRITTLKRDPHSASGWAWGA